MLAEPTATTASERMNAARSSRPPPVPVTDALIERMERDAAAALRRRPPAYFIEAGVESLGMLATAVLSLAALWLWEAPPVLILLWLLASAWIGICGEWLKYAVLGELVRREMAIMANDQQVWFVADALRHNSKFLRRRTMTSYTPWRALLFDFVAGIAATSLALLAVWHGETERALPLDVDPGLRLSIAAVLGLQLGSVLWASMRHRLGAATVQADFAGGVRGAALIVLGILVLWFGAQTDELRRALSVASGLLLLVFLLHVGGTLIQLRDTRWLRDYMHGEGRTRSGSTESRW